MNPILPLASRRADWPLVAFFLLNLFFITYVFDFEQLSVPDTSQFTYPIWPPSPLVDLFHNYGNSLDPLMMARPAWWKATILIDVLLFGPFYTAALYALVRGRDWIRVPSLVYSGMMISNVLIILVDEFFGQHPAPQPLLVLLLNLPWLLMPAYIIFRLGLTPHPFQVQRP